MLAETGQAADESGSFEQTEAESGVRIRPKRVAKPVAPTWLSSEEEDDLRRYYRNGGSSATTRSATAACLAVIEQRASIGIPCERCGGDIERGTPGTGFIDSATGKAPGRPADESGLLGLLVTHADAAEGASEAREPTAGELPPVAFGDQLCPDCEGRCWLVGAAKPPKRPKPTCPAPPASPFRTRSLRVAVDGMPNVYPTGSQDGPSGYEMSDQMHGDLAFLGSMSHRIRSLLDLVGGHAAQEALACFYAPDGGTTAALWHLVPAGRKLLRTNPLKLHHSQLFANLREQQRLKFDANRAALFQAADKQSEKLYEHACGMWRRTAAKPQASAGAPSDHLTLVESLLSGAGAETLSSESTFLTLAREAGALAETTLLAVTEANPEAC